MPLDINAFRSIASQSPDKLVYVQGESLKTTRNQAHHAAHTYKAAPDAFLAAFRQHYGAALGDALKRHLEAEGNAGKPLTARTIKALVAFADEKIGSATHVDAAGRSVKLDEIGTDDLSRVGWSQAGKIAKAEAGQKKAAAVNAAYPGAAGPGWTAQIQANITSTSAEQDTIEGYLFKSADSLDYSRIDELDEAHFPLLTKYYLGAE